MGMTDLPDRYAKIPRAQPKNCRHIYIRKISSVNVVSRTKLPRCKDNTKQGKILCMRATIASQQC